MGVGGEGVLSKRESEKGGAWNRIELQGRKLSSIYPIGHFFPLSYSHSVDR